MTQNEICGVCNELHPREEMAEFDGTLLCESCFAAETTVCSRCGERIWEEDNAGNSSIPLCQTCYDDYYTSCSRCGRLMQNEDAIYHDDTYDYPLCCECDSHSRRGYAIQDYYYKPKPIFRGCGNRFFGVELEVDEGGESDRSASAVMEIANYDVDNLYCKHDGSLDDGFELVTHPMTLDYHMGDMPWEKCLDKLKSMGYLSHQAGTCGLHIHVNRNTFGDTEEKQEEVIARILYFFEKHWDELLKFSRRTVRQLERWAARYGYKDHPKDILDHAKKYESGTRYTCINLQNENTIEFRMFRGTLKYNTVIATLQLVDQICDVAVSLSDDNLREMSWTTFVSRCHYPELIQYLKERQLYINEPVETEEDI